MCKFGVCHSVVIKESIFLGCDTMLLGEECWCFEGIQCLHLQGWSM